jgi:hypothetical protein
MFARIFEVISDKIQMDYWKCMTLDILLVDTSVCGIIIRMYYSLVSEYGLENI